MKYCGHAGGMIAIGAKEQDRSEKTAEKTTQPGFDQRAAAQPKASLPPPQQCENGEREGIAQEYEHHWRHVLCIEKVGAQRHAAEDHRA